MLSVLTLDTRGREPNHEEALEKNCQERKASTWPPVCSKYYQSIFSVHEGKSFLTCLEGFFLRECALYEVYDPHIMMLVRLSRSRSAVFSPGCGCCDSGPFVRETHGAQHTK